MAHQMKHLCGFSVFHCVEGAFGASSGGTPKINNRAPRDELKNGRGRGWAVAYVWIPHIARCFLCEVSNLPKWCDITPPLVHLVSRRRICAIPQFATCRAIIVRYPTKTSTGWFCDTFATSIVRYEEYRCWASKCATKWRKMYAFGR